MNDPIIKLQGLEKRYGALTAVNDLHLEIQRGEIFGLLGPNGAGKTTTILMMLGLTEPSDGQAMVCGHDATRHPIPVKKKVGYLPDSVGFYTNMTALENLSFIAQLNGFTRREGHQKALDLLRIVGLIDVADKKVSTFSRGMKQRLGLADVLIKDPEVIILDEPTLGIDPRGVSEFLDLIKHLSVTQQLTVLLSSHHLQQVQRVCDRVGIFVKGQLLEVGAIDELASKLLKRDGNTTVVDLATPLPDLERVQEQITLLPDFIDCNLSPTRIEIKTGSEQTPQIVQLLVQQDAQIDGVRRKSYGLDEIYSTYFEEQNADKTKNNEKSTGFFNRTFHGKAIEK